MTKVKICSEPDCHNAQTSQSYCRLHYVKNWRKLKEERQKKAADKLNKYVDGICKKHPEKYVDVIRREIRDGSGEFVRALDDVGGDVLDEIGENMGFQDEESLDRLVSKIRLDKDF